MHGLLLTGGRSSRLGRDKAHVELEGRPLALRVADALAAVAAPVLAVGPPVGTLEGVDDRREGPLAALAAGAEELRRRDCNGPVLLLACDLPFVTAEVLRLVAGADPAADAVVPVVEGHDQPLVACYRPRALDAALALVAGGARSMRELLADVVVRRLDERVWMPSVPAKVFSDVDSAADLARAAATAREESTPRARPR